MTAESASRGPHRQGTTNQGASSQDTSSLEAGTRVGSSGPSRGPVGFTAVYCGRPNCPTHTHDGGVEVAAALRAAVRACPHGVLVTTGCLHTSLRSAASDSLSDCPRCTAGRGPGPLVIVQPCCADRTPCGPLVVAGPLHEPADLTELCSWLSHGLTRDAPLPRHLHATRH